jgi:hypothetical protein
VFPTQFRVGIHGTEVYYAGVGQGPCLVEVPDIRKKKKEKKKSSCAKPELFTSGLLCLLSYVLFYVQWTNLIVLWFYCVFHDDWICSVF